MPWPCERPAVRGCPAADPRPGNPRPATLPPTTIPQHEVEPSQPAWALSFPLPSAWVEGYAVSAADQPFLLEVWVEKSTMNDVLLPLCRALGVNLVTSAGFQSMTSAVKLLERV